LALEGRITTSRTDATAQEIIVAIVKVDILNCRELAGLVAKNSFLSLQEITGRWGFGRISDVCLRFRVS